jgi:hypothetical protein
MPVNSRGQFFVTIGRPPGDRATYGGRMGQIGELFPGPKIRKESQEDAGTGDQPFEIESLDLDRGVIRVTPRQAPRAPEERPEG